ncbi:MAG: TerC family protein [Burkholderiaceae bacterium]|nr:TerC family protein [Burkholderiaceae bacterium]MCD8537494.1 TerC family protein [Burkholderiaceae bacterium]
MDILQNISLIVIIHIILIDLLLSADNAVVIAVACRNLDPARRQQGIVWGTLGAIVLRMALIFVALSLLSIPGLRIVGGLLLAWIAMRLLQKPEPDHTRIAAGASMLAAIKTIVVADFLMSLDNVLAISGAVHVGLQTATTEQQFAMVVIGLLISVPMMILASSLVLKLLDRFPILVLAGVGLLGWIAGGMIATDILVLDQFGEISSLAKLTAQIVGSVAVITAGRYWAGRAQKAREMP